MDAFDFDGCSICLSETLDNPRFTVYIIKPNLIKSADIMQDIKPLLVFSAVLEHGSMHAAAAALGMTPSAVSQHISRLEALHGVKLLQRSTRRLIPTDAGLSIGSYCRRLQQTLADTQQALDNLKTEAAGEVRITLTSSLIHAPAWQNAFKRLQHEFPAIRPVLYLNDHLADLQQESFDIALRGGDTALDAPDLIARPLAVWPWRICAAPAYLDAHEPITEPEALHRHRWINRLPIHVLMRRGAETYPLHIDNSLYCNQLSAVHTLTLGGFGLSLQLAGEISADLAEGSLQTVLPEWTLPTVSLYAVTSYRVQSAKTEAVLRVLQQSFAAAQTAAP